MVVGASLIMCQTCQGQRFYLLGISGWAWVRVFCVSHLLANLRVPMVLPFSVLGYGGCTSQASPPPREIGLLCAWEQVYKGLFDLAARVRKEGFGSSRPRQEWKFYRESLFRSMGSHSGKQQGTTPGGCNRHSTHVQNNHLGKIPHFQTHHLDPCSDAQNEDVFFRQFP